MSDDRPEAGDSEIQVIGEFAYALPAAVILVLAGLLTLAWAGQLVSAPPRALNVAVAMTGLGAGVAGVVGGWRFWSRRSWLVLTIPIWLIPLSAALGYMWLINNWGGH